MIVTTRLFVRSFICPRGGEHEFRIDLLDSDAAVAGVLVLGLAQSDWVGSGWQHHAAVRAVLVAGVEGIWSPDTSMRNRQTRQENRAILVFLGIVVLILLLAAYGYFSGGWETQPPS
jgi:hypothetical protein